MKGMAYGAFVSVLFRGGTYGYHHTVMSDVCLDKCHDLVYAGAVGIVVSDVSDSDHMWVWTDGTHAGKAFVARMCADILLSEEG